MAAKKRTTKRTTKKASNSIVEPTPTTSSNGRRIAILVIVVLGIVILWRNDSPSVDTSNGTTPAENTIDNSEGTDYGDDGQKLNYNPNDRNYDYTPNRTYDYSPQSGN